MCIILVWQHSYTSDEDTSWIYGKDTLPASLPRGFVAGEGPDEDLLMHMWAIRIRGGLVVGARARPRCWRGGDHGRRDSVISEPTCCWAFLTSLPKVDSFLILITVPKMSNLSLMPLKSSCHPQHDIRDAVLKYAIAHLNK